MSAERYSESKTFNGYDYKWIVTLLGKRYRVIENNPRRSRKPSRNFGIHEQLESVNIVFSEIFRTTEKEIINRFKITRVAGNEEISSSTHSSHCAHARIIDLTLYAT